MPSPLTAALMRRRASLRRQTLAVMSERELRAWDGDFAQWTHEGQAAPQGEWRTWVMMAGRGFGKTRAGAEWVLSLVRPSIQLGTNGEKESPSTASGRTEKESSGRTVAGGNAGASTLHIALVAATLDEARRVMVEGPSGIVALAKEGEIDEWSFERRTIRFASGAEATLFSGAHPEGLRGPEHDFAWCDELAKWRRGGETWSNLQLGLRRGVSPRSLVTTTPRRVAALRAVLGEEGVAVTGGRSRDNPHVPDAWLGAMERMHGGTQHGRQELGGELLEDVEGALWPRQLIERSRMEGPLHHPASRDGPQHRVDHAPHGQGSSGGRPDPVLRAGEDFRSVVIGVDPPAGTPGDACGIVACGVDGHGIGYVIADHSEHGLSPEAWARKVAAAAEMHGAGRVIAEANMGGRMVESVLRAAGVRTPVRLVHASESKVARAAPVAALFEAKRARFAGTFPELEDELAGLAWDGSYEGPGRSPDRADAMVWAMTALMLGPAQEPAVRSF